MSALDFASQMNFGDRRGLQEWFLAHAQQHQLYAGNLVSRYGAQPPLFDLADPAMTEEWATAMQQKQDGVMTPRMVAWLLAHQALHAAEFVTIGAGQPVDLSQVDFRDEGQFYDWMSNHIALHDAEDQVLT
jgi:hypothetical protein